ncbi:MAG: hypothetical protein IE909_06455 [Campylobacterales bacterium]|nr:hypothetical protein [Campylobacterales bacterium]
MLAYRLEIADKTVAQKILNFLATRPKESVNFTPSKPSLSEELKRRVNEIQEDKIQLLSHEQMWQEIVLTQRTFLYKRV